MIKTRGSGRTLLLAVILILLFAGLGFRLFFLHFRLDADYIATIEGSREYKTEIPARRGRIFDRQKRLLAADLALKHICADPKMIVASGQLERFADLLSRELPLSRAEVYEKLNRPDRRYVRLVKYAGDEMTERVRALDLDYVFYEDVYRRHYPNGPLMSHVIGFANAEGTGSAGIELRWNSSLSGTPGLHEGEKDGRRREIYTRRRLEVPPVPGADVYLTLDSQIQHITEKALNDVFVEFNAQAAWAVVQRVRTGEVLALASIPPYDLNNYSRAPDEWRRDRTIRVIYEPGSVMKALTIASAINEGVVTENDIVDCGKGIWYYGGRSLKEYGNHAYGKLSVADVLIKSSNIGTAQIALKLGEAKLEEYFRAFGIGSKTGCGLPGEEAGLFYPHRKWSKIDITRIPMGHTVSVTALQMANAVSAIANDGVLMKPYVVSKVVAHDGEELFRGKPERIGRPIRREVARQMWRMMERVTEPGGTATSARIEGYRVAGKTGTAMKIGPDGHYLNGHNVASFAGFVPADRPELSIIVVVDDPTGRSRTGGGVAAPAFREIAEQSLRYLGVPSDETEEVYAPEPFVETRGDEE